MVLRGVPSLRTLPLFVALFSACVTGEPASTSSAPPTAMPAVADADAAEGKAIPKSEMSQQTVEVDGHPITVWSKSAPEPWGSIVLLHGRTWSARPDFDLQVPGESRSTMDALVAEGMAVYAMDMRGYGGTPRDDTQWLTPDRAVKDLAAVLEWVGQQHPSLPPPTMLGWSLGSLVSQLTAQRHPALMSEVVLFGYPRKPGATYDPDPTPMPDPERRTTTAEAAAEDFIIPGSISKAGIDAFVKAALSSDPVRMDWRASDQWDALDPAAVKIPTLLIHGEKDPYAPMNNQTTMFNQLGHPDREWVIVAGGDHAAHMENSGPRFVHAVVEFIRRPH